MPELKKRYEIKSFSLPIPDVVFIQDVAWSRRVSASAVVSWALQILREAIDAEPPASDEKR